MMQLRFEGRNPAIEQRVDYAPLSEYYRARGLESSDVSAKVKALATDLNNVSGGRFPIDEYNPLSLVELVFRETCEAGEIKVVGGKLHYVPLAERTIN